MKISEYHLYLDKGSRLAALGRLADGEGTRRARQRGRRRDVEQGDRRCDRGAEYRLHGGSLEVEEVNARPIKWYVVFLLARNRMVLSTAVCMRS